MQLHEDAASREPSGDGRVHAKHWGLRRKDMYQPVQRLLAERDGRWWSSELGWMVETENRVQKQLKKGGWPPNNRRFDISQPSSTKADPSSSRYKSRKITGNLDHLSFNSNLFICQSFKSNSPSFNSSCSPFQTNVLPFISSSSPFR